MRGSDANGFVVVVVVPVIPGGARTSGCWPMSHLCADRRVNRFELREPRSQTASHRSLDSGSRSKSAPGMTMLS